MTFVIIPVFAGFLCEVVLTTRGMNFWPTFWQPLIQRTTLPFESHFVSGIIAHGVRAHARWVPGPFGEIAGGRARARARAGEVAVGLSPLTSAFLCDSPLPHM